MAESTIPPPLGGVDRNEWDALVRRGQRNGVLHADEIAPVLRNVELSSDALLAVSSALTAVGIEVDETVVDEDLTPHQGLSHDLAAVEADEQVEELLSRRRQGRSVRRAARVEPGTSDTVRLYLRDIGQVDLLNVDDERRLAQLIEQGHQAAAAIDAGAADEAEQRRLTRAVNRGERAKSELIQANLRLVVSIAKRYSGRGMQLLDLIQEGNLGLMRAVDKFDHTKGFKFSTYATWWIRQAITRAIADQARTIRIPVHMVEHMNRINRVRREMVLELRREPSVDELAVRLQMDPDRVRDLLRYALDPLSLDSPVGEEEESNLGDFISDPNIQMPEDNVEQQSLNEVVEEILSELPEREQEIVRSRFGLGPADHQGKTLEEVGKELGVTRERIRQIEAKTLAKLRHPERKQRLRSFLEND